MATTKRRIRLSRVTVRGPVPADLAERLAKAQAEALKANG
jgi:hypothetical protein